MRPAPGTNSFFIGSTIHRRIEPARGSGRSRSWVRSAGVAVGAGEEPMVGGEIRASHEDVAGSPQSRREQLGFIQQVAAILSGRTGRYDGRGVSRLIARDRQ